MIWLLLSCKEDPTIEKNAIDPYDVQVGPYSTNIRWTDYGTTHRSRGLRKSWIRYGLCLGQRSYCTPGSIVRIRGERAQYHGSDFIDEDFGWRDLTPLTMLKRIFRHSRTGSRDAHWLCCRSEPLPRRGPATQACDRQDSPNHTHRPVELLPCTWFKGVW